MKRTMKRGISPLISWVLLVGFAVALSVMVTNWVKTQTESTTQELTTGLESDLRCGEVALNAKLDCTLAPVKIALGNKGKFTIHKVRVRQPGQTTEKIIDLAPTMEGTENLNSFNTAMEADIIPVILFEGEEIICSARKVVITC